MQEKFMFSAMESCSFKCLISGVGGNHRYYISLGRRNLTRYIIEFHVISNEEKKLCMIIKKTVDNQFKFIEVR